MRCSWQRPAALEGRSEVARAARPARGGAACRRGAPHARAAMAPAVAPAASQATLGRTAAPRRRARCGPPPRCSAPPTPPSPVQPLRAAVRAARLALAAAAAAAALAPSASAITENQLLFLEAWRAVDRAYVDKTFNGQSWFRYREAAVKKTPMDTREETYAAIRAMLATLVRKAHPRPERLAAFAVLPARAALIPRAPNRAGGPVHALPGAGPVVGAAGRHQRESQWRRSGDQPRSHRQGRRKHAGMRTLVLSFESTT